LLDLVVIDECHRGSGAYDAAPARRFSTMDAAYGRHFVRVPRASRLVIGSSCIRKSFAQLSAEDDFSIGRWKPSLSR